MKIAKKILSLLLAVIMAISIIPLQNLMVTVYAANNMSIVFQRVQDTGTKNTQQYVISYSSDNPLNKPVIEITDVDGGGLTYSIDTVKYPEADLIKGSQIIIEQSITTKDTVYGASYAAVFGEGVKIVKVTNKLSDGTLDTPVSKSIRVITPAIITNTNVTNKLHYVGDPLTISGDNFRVKTSVDPAPATYEKSVKTVLVDGVNCTFTHGGELGKVLNVNTASAGIKTGEIRTYIDTDNGGPIDLNGDGDTTDAGEAAATMPNSIQTIYQNSVYVVSKLSGIDVETVQPNSGSVNGGTYVKIKNTTGLTGLNDQLKVYFPRTTNGIMEALSDANLATANSYNPANYTLTVRTKASTKGAGDARIIITSADGTSRYDDSANPLIYTFVEAGNTMTVSNITPATAKASSAANITIVGKNIATLNLPGISYQDGKDFSSSITNVANVQNGEVSTTVVNLDDIKYNLNGSDVAVDVVKKLNIVIGGSVTAVTVMDAVYGSQFSPYSTFSTQQDQLYVKLPIINLGTKEFDIYDAVISAETIVYNHGTLIETVPSKIEEVTLTNSFTYTSDFIVPTVSSITPNYGAKDKTITVRIKGTNFGVLQQADERIRPTVKIGVTPIDANVKVIPSANVRVYNSATMIEVDGSATNYKGDLIVATIPATPDGNVFLDANVYVYNPDGGQPGILLASFKFKDPLPSDYPYITNVSPNLVSTMGGEEITVTGSNFKTNSELYIGGQKVTPITINGTGEKIVFKSPVNKVGIYNLQIFNPDTGAVATSTIEYASIYTSPKITSISPAKGGTSTLVTIKGENFLKTDQTAKPDELYKIVGARVKFDGKDLNSYNLDSAGAIKLSDYNYKAGTTKPMIADLDGDGVLELDPVYNDVVLVNGTEGIFTIGTESDYVVLRDGNGNVYTAYIDTSDSNKIKLRNQNGTISNELTYVYTGTATTISFTINALPYVLEAKTAYSISTDASNFNTITGKKVRVITDKYIEVTIPPLIPSQGLNDVMVVNPDTAYAIKTDGFFYFSSIGLKPTITSVYPKEGSIGGGTIIKIVGTGFRDDTQIYFGSEYSKSRIISTDGKTIYAQLPAYPDVFPTGVDSMTVPLVVINTSDGGSATWIERFTYKVPTSYPEITRLNPVKWNANGGIDVTIYGKNFTQGEPYKDLDGSGSRDVGEPYTDINEDGYYQSTWIYNNPVAPFNQIVDQDLAPRVYFGGERAIVKDYMYNRLIVTLPKYSGSGVVDVILVNPDTGTVVKKGGFTYEVSTPKITTVTPAKGKKAGGTEVSIKGTGFIVGTEAGGDLAQVFIGDDNDKATQLISGGALIDTITLGSLKIDYNNNTLYPGGNNTRFVMKYSLKNVAGTVVDISVTKYANVTDENKAVFATFAPADFIALGADATELARIIDGNEKVRVIVKNGEMSATRRLAEVDEANSTDQLLIVNTPPSTTIGIKTLTLLNNDGGTTSSKYEYGNPVSEPKIISVVPNRLVTYTVGSGTAQKYLVEVSVNGGEQIRITGYDLRDGIKVFLADQEATVLSIASLGANKYELVASTPVPKAENIGKELKVTVINTDTASSVSTNYTGTPPADWHPYWFIYKEASTSPTIASVSPNKGPKIGGTTITIEGGDFREGAKVFIGGLECTNVVVVSYNKITAVTSEIKAPILVVGTYGLEVKNYENGVLTGTGLLPDGFTYISSPVINGVYETLSVDANGKYTMGDSITKFKVTGNETVIMDVDDLHDNAQIMIGATITTITNYSNIPTGIRAIDSAGNDVVVVGGTAATIIQRQDEIYIVMKTPILTEGTDYTIILINADGGVSEPFSVSYIKPLPNEPGKPKVAAVDGDTIKVEWTKLDSVLYYELYITKGKGEKYPVYMYIGSVEPYQFDDTTLRYYVDGLESSTYYKVKLKAVNLFGVSEFSNESNYVQTLAEVKASYYIDETKYAGGIQQADVVNNMADNLSYSIGETSLKSSSGVQLDFTKPQYAKENKKAVDLFFELLNKYTSKKIALNDKDFSLNLTTAALMTDQVVNVPKVKQTDAKVILIINKNLGEKEEEIVLNMPKGYKMVKAPIEIQLSMQVGRDTTKIAAFKNNVDMKMNYNESAQNIFKGGILFGYYDSTNKSVVIIDTRDNNGYAETSLTKTGQYLLVGKISK